MMKRSVSLFHAAVAAVAMYGGAGKSNAQDDTHPLSLGRMFSSLVAERDVTIETGVPYGSHPRHRLDVYRPVSTSEPSAIVVFYYGGGWTDGERATYGFVGAALAARGITTVIPDYRLYPEVVFPAFVDDAALAYAWVAKNLASPSDRRPDCPQQPRRPIIVAGHSAGAYIAGMIALNPSYLAHDQYPNQPLPQPAGLIGLAGPYAFDPTTWPSTKSIFAPAARMPDTARPIAFARANAPPTLLMHGLDDETVKLYNSRDLAEKLRQLNTNVELIEFPAIGHVGLVLALATPFRWRAPVLTRMIDFVKLHGEAASSISKCDIRR